MRSLLMLCGVIACGEPSVSWQNPAPLAMDEGDIEPGQCPPTLWLPLRVSQWAEADFPDDCEDAAVWACEDKLDELTTTYHGFCDAYCGSCDPLLTGLFGEACELSVGPLLGETGYSCVANGSVLYQCVCESL